MTQEEKLMPFVVFTFYAGEDFNGGTYSCCGSVYFFFWCLKWSGSLSGCGNFIPKMAGTFFVKIR
jgi:hypothetical protein